MKKNDLRIKVASALGESTERVRQMRNRDDLDPNYSKCVITYCEMPTAYFLKVTENMRFVEVSVRYAPREEEVIAEFPYRCAEVLLVKEIDAAIRIYDAYLAHGEKA